MGPSQIVDGPFLIPVDRGWFVLGAPVHLRFP